MSDVREIQLIVAEVLRESIVLRGFRGFGDKILLASLVVRISFNLYLDNLTSVSLQSATSSLLHISTIIQYKYSFVKLCLESYSLSPMSGSPGTTSKALLLGWQYSYPSSMQVPQGLWLDGDCMK